MPDIDRWKSMYRRIWKVVIGGQSYIYRELNAGEYLGLVGASHSDCEFEEGIIGEALLYPDLDLDTSPARLVTDIANHILTSNMFDDSDRWIAHVNSVKDRIRPRKAPGGKLITDDPIMGMVVQITSAFPAYRPEDVLAMSMEDILDRLAWSELALGDAGPPNVPDGMNPMEKESATASTNALYEEMRKHNAKSRS